MKPHVWSLCLFLAWSSFTLAGDPPRPFKGKVIGISEGDTISVLWENAGQHVRLEAIDAPEKGQAFGNRAREALGDKIAGEPVRVVWSKKDRHGRILGHVYLGNRWINHELVGEGSAWHFKRHSQDNDLAEAEAEARHEGLGLWADHDPVPPWQFRKEKANARKRKGR